MKSEASCEALILQKRNDFIQDVGLALNRFKLIELTIGVNELRAAQATAITRQDL